MNENEGKSIISNALQSEFISESSLTKLKEAEERYHSIKTQIEAVKLGDSSISKESAYDWTHTYKSHDKFIDLEDLELQKLATEKEISALKDYHNGFMGHSHDHKKEKEIFDQSNSKKLALSERYLFLAMSKEREAYLPKAIELFKIALSYSEYIFPESDEESAALQAIRYTVLMNLGNLHCNFGNTFEALRFVELSLKETNERPLLVKAFSLMGKIHHRSYEYRYLQRYLVFLVTMIVIIVIP
jgi:hypothetical protein